MQYQKITSGNTIIEFHNNWLGEETVIINGQIVSKKSSIWGTHHHFTVMEEGRSVRYVLTTKVNANLQVLLDLQRNGEMVQEDIKIQVMFGTMPKRPKNEFKKNGIEKLKEYDLNNSIEDLTKALDIDPDDPEIYFHLACAYSLQEQTVSAFENIKMAVEKRMQDTEMILNHDMLAYIRMHPAFEEFLNSNFTEYDKKLIEKNTEEDDFV